MVPFWRSKPKKKAQTSDRFHKKEHPFNIFDEFELFKPLFYTKKGRCHYRIPPWLILFFPALIACLFSSLYNDPNNLPSGTHPLFFFQPKFLDAVDMVVSQLSVLLAFLIPLQISRALELNRSGNSYYSALLGDVLALDLFVLSFVEKDNSESKDKIKNLSLIIPGLIKWQFRGGLDLNELTVGNGVKLSVADERIHENLLCLSDVRETSAHIGIFESVMLLLAEYLTELRDQQENEKAKLALQSDEASTKTAAKLPGVSNSEHEILLKKWNDIYASYGNIGNTFGYQQPRLLQNLIRQILLLYFLLLPLTLIRTNFNAIWASFISSYVFLGFWIARSYVSNPFARSNSLQFQTVSDVEKSMRNQIRELFKRFKSHPDMCDEWQKPPAGEAAKKMKTYRPSHFSW